MLNRCWLLGRCGCDRREGPAPAAPGRVVAAGAVDDASIPAVLGEMLERLEVPLGTTSVALKLNLCEYRDGASGATTSVAFVRHVVAALRRQCEGLRRIVLLEHDSSGTRAVDLYELLGFGALAREEGLELFDPSSAAWQLVDTVGELPIEMPTIVDEVDLFVNLPKMKLHGKTLFTGALKNNFGLVRRKWKLPFHERLCETIIASNLHLPLQLCLMDGVVALSGRGPAYGVPCRPGVVLGSWDPVAVDAVGARLSGLPVGVVGHLRLARDAGIGSDVASVEWLDEYERGDALVQMDWLRVGLATALRR